MIHRIASLLAILAAILALSGSCTGVSFSPDSKRLVVAGNHGLHIMNLDGSGVKLLPESNGGTGPSWSPNGRWITFAHNSIAMNGENQRYETWVYSVKQNQSHKISDDFGAPYAWREDGARLAGIRPGDDKQKARLYVCDPDGGAVVQETDLLAAENGNSLWVPHTDTLVILDGTEPRVIRTGGTGRKIIMSKRTGELFKSYWSSDGKQIALQEIITNRKHNRLFLYDADGCNERCIYTDL